MSQLCRTCDRPATIMDSRAIDKNVTRRRYRCQDEQCGDRWSTVELIIADRQHYKEMKKEMDAAEQTISALKQIREIASGVL